MNSKFETLYHYCSIESLFHIVNSKSIWLSNSIQMNDSAESLWIEKHFETIIKHFKSPKYSEFLKDVFQTYRLNNHPPYIFCLSEKKDLLSQWRAYSNDGRGVSIGFNTKFLEIGNSIPSPNIYAENTLGFYRVKYTLIGQSNKISEVCESIKVDFENPKIDKISLCLEFVSLLANWSLVFKNPSFKEEGEWRIIHTPTDHYEKPHNKLSDIKFRLNNNKIISYFILSFGENFNQELVPEIILGPKCEMTMQDIKQFLFYNKLANTKLSVSKSTYK